MLALHRLDMSKIMVTAMTTILQYIRAHQRSAMGTIMIATDWQMTIRKLLRSTGMQMAMAMAILQAQHCNHVQCLPAM